MPPLYGINIREYAWLAWLSIFFIICLEDRNRIFNFASTRIEYFLFLVV